MKLLLHRAGFPERCWFLFLLLPLFVGGVWGGRSRESQRLMESPPGVFVMFHPRPANTSLLHSPLPDLSGPTPPHPIRTSSRSAGGAAIRPGVSRAGGDATPYARPVVRSGCTVAASGRCASDGECGAPRRRSGSRWQPKRSGIRARPGGGRRCVTPARLADRAPGPCRGDDRERDRSSRTIARGDGPAWLGSRGPRRGGTAQSCDGERCARRTVDFGPIRGPAPV